MTTSNTSSQTLDVLHHINISNHVAFVDETIQVGPFVCIQYHICRLYFSESKILEEIYKPTV